MTDSPARLLPRATPETVFWWDNCRNHRLLIQHCPDCGAYQFYPRLRCSACAGGNLGWVEASGSATVETFTICRVPVTEAYTERLPYVVAIVRLAEGPAMMTNIIGCEPDCVSIGMRVEVDFEDWDEQVTLPQFRPRRTAEE